MGCSARPTRGPRWPRNKCGRGASERALEAQLARLALHDKRAAFDDVPLRRRAQRDQERLLERHDALVALLLGEGDGADREALLTERVGGRRKGVAAAEARRAVLIADREGRPLQAREGLAVDAD